MGTSSGTNETGHGECDADEGQLTREARIKDRMHEPVAVLQVMQNDFGACL